MDICERHCPFAGKNGYRRGFSFKCACEPDGEPHVVMKIHHVVDRGIDVDGAVYLGTCDFHTDARSLGYLVPDYRGGYGLYCDDVSLVMKDVAPHVTRLGDASACPYYSEIMMAIWNSRIK